MVDDKSRTSPSGIKIRVPITYNGIQPHVQRVFPRSAGLGPTQIADDHFRSAVPEQRIRNRELTGKFSVRGEPGSGRDITRIGRIIRIQRGDEISEPFAVDDQFVRSAQQVDDPCG